MNSFQQKTPPPPVSLYSRWELKMIGAVSSFFECSLLLFATFAALFSIVSPKLKGAAYYAFILLPLSVLLPVVVTEAAEKAKDGHSKAE